MPDNPTPPSTVSLTAPTRLLIALAALSTTTSLPSYPPPPPSTSTFDSLIDDDETQAAREASIKAANARTEAAFRAEGKIWLAAVCKIVEIDPKQLPEEIDAERVKASVQEQRDGWTEEERERVAGVLVEAGLAASKESSASEKTGVEKQVDGGGGGSGGLSATAARFGFGSSSEKDKEAEKKTSEAQLRYTPLHRTFAHSTLSLLSLSPSRYLPLAEAHLGTTLFSALKSASDAQTQTVESTRAKHSEGWGGSLGRKLATGAGVIAGGVLLGVTGGLAAPAIAAVLAPLGIGGILSAGAAPVVLGTLFGVGGGGLAGRRVRERWRGVGEFGFVEVGKGTKVTKEEAEDSRGSNERYKARVRKPRAQSTAGADGANVGTEGSAASMGKAEQSADSAAQSQDTIVTEKSTEEQVQDGRASLEERLLSLSLAPASGNGQAGATSVSKIELDSPRASMDGGRPSLNAPAEESEIKDAPHPPSLTATIVVPGLLTVSETEAISAWRAICSGKPVYSATLEQVSAQNQDAEKARADEKAEGKVARQSQAGQGDTSADTADSPPGPEAPIELSAATASVLASPTRMPLSDGRDVYLLRFEPSLMLKTGREIDHWVTSKLKGKIKAEIIKRTVLNAYFAAVSLPLTVYGVASMSLDNSWMQAQDRANKAGRILGEVLEQRVQGERPVVLVSHPTWDTASTRCQYSTKTIIGRLATPRPGDIARATLIYRSVPPSAP